MMSFSCYQTISQLVISEITLHTSSCCRMGNQIFAFFVCGKNALFLWFIYWCHVGGYSPITSFVIKLQKTNDWGMVKRSEWVKYMKIAMDWLTKWLLHTPFILCLVGYSPYIVWKGYNNSAYQKKQLLPVFFVIKMFVI